MNIGCLTDVLDKVNILTRLGIQQVIYNYNFTIMLYNYNNNSVLCYIYTACKKKFLFGHVFYLPYNLNNMMEVQINYELFNYNILYQSSKKLTNKLLTSYLC